METSQQFENPASSLSPSRSYVRTDGRSMDKIRPLRFQNHIAPHALGSTLVRWGNTHVICAVCCDEIVPRWMKEQGIDGGWLTAEYSMLPYSTSQRKPRDISRGKLEGRTQEIQRLIGRAMRAAVDLKSLGTRTLWIDCDVLQADGGTRTASITGSFVALSLAIKRMLSLGKLTKNPIIQSVAAVSLGVVQQQVLLDLNYIEDTSAEVDLNLVMTSRGEFIEVQGTAEKTAFSQRQLDTMLALGKKGIEQLIIAQNAAVEDAGNDSPKTSPCP
jgi:ribonuclease PH